MLAAVSGLVSVLTGLLGVHGAWLDWPLSLLFLGGMADMAIAAVFDALSWGGEERGRPGEYPRVTYPSGLSSRTPWVPTDDDLENFKAALCSALADPWPPEKRLMTPTAPPWQER
jgi:hypothetical protein